MTPPSEVTLELTPRARYDAIDVRSRLAEGYGDLLSSYRRVLYCSYHTTAGYLEQSLASRLGERDERLDPYIGLFRELFPPDADYNHDKLHLRSELSPEQRQNEPKNADSHLAFIGSGLRNCVTYVNRDSAPVYFIDLDGVNGEEARHRQTTVLAFNREIDLGNLETDVPVSTHPVDSINLKDPRVGLYAELEREVERRGIQKGRVDIALEASERNAGLTVNEYETLLMKHDLAEVLRNPLRYMAEKGRNMLADPRAIPGKTRDYAKYDLVRFINQMIDSFGASESLIERVMARVLAVPAERFLRLKRSVSLLVSDRNPQGRPAIVQGTYQSPVLVQWSKADAGRRRLSVKFTRFE